MQQRESYEPTQAATHSDGGAKDKTSPLKALETTAAILLANRFIWLVVVLALYLLGQLSYTQWRSATHTAQPRFETMELMSLLLAVVEVGLLGVVLLLALGLPKARDAWHRLHPAQSFSYGWAGLAAPLIVGLVLLILLAPLLYLHRYPELAAEGIRIPLMLTQRALLIASMVLVAYNVILILRLYLRLPWWLSGLLGAASHLGTTYYLTLLSYKTEIYMRLNDVFFYNQLWRYVDGFPNLQRSEVFHNIEMPYYAYYLCAAVVLWWFTLLLWLPRAGSDTYRGGMPKSRS